MASLPPNDEAVTVAYVHSENVSHSWHLAMREMLAHDISHNRRVIAGGWIATRYGTGGIAKARNETVEAFLAQPFGWLMWVDTDMGFPGDGVDRLCQFADPVFRPIVGGLCFGMDVASDFDHTMTTRATIYDWAGDNHDSGLVVRNDYLPNELTRCTATGSAFVLVCRNVFVEVAKKFGPEWYSPMRYKSNRMVMGEDLSFCLRCGALNIPVHVHTGIKTTHHKAAWLSESLHQRLRAHHDPAGSGQREVG